MVLLRVLRISMLHGSQAKAGWADCNSIRMFLLEICTPDRVNADDRRTVMLPSTVPRGSAQAEEATLPHHPPKNPLPHPRPTHHHPLRFLPPSQPQRSLPVGVRFGAMFGASPILPALSSLLNGFDGSCVARARERPLGTLIEHLELSELDVLVALVGDNHILPREDRVRLLRRLVRPLVHEHPAHAWGKIVERRDGHTRLMRESLSGHQCGHQGSSGVLRGPQWSSVVIRAVIRSQQWSSQGSSGVLMVTRAFGSKAFVRPSLVIDRMLRYASNCVQNRFM
jgi:hypothetical protein